MRMRIMGFHHPVCGCGAIWTLKYYSEKAGND